MSKPRAHIQLPSFQRIGGTPILPTYLTSEDVLDETYTVKYLPEEIDILFWGSIVQHFGPNEDIPIAVTFAFSRIKSKGVVLAVVPMDISFDPE